MLFSPAIQPAPTASVTAWCFAFVEGQLLMPEPDEATLLPMSPSGFGAAVRHYLGRLDTHDCWALRLDALPAGWRRVPLRAAMQGFPAPLAALASRAAQVLEWDRTHRHCGVCGTPTEAATHERARRCPACGHTAYPRLSPAMMALVWREGEVLLTLDALPQIPARLSISGHLIRDTVLAMKEGRLGG